MSTLTPQSAPDGTGKTAGQFAPDGTGKTAGQPVAQSAPEPEHDSRFGLIGRKLGHSWSPIIHAQLGTHPYHLIELEPNDVESFLRQGSWQGLNVTIPYKRVAVECATVVSERVKRLGAANTLTKDSSGTIYADNTDVIGFSYMLERFSKRHFGASAAEVFAASKLVVLGSGGGSTAVVAALEEIPNSSVVVISRSGDNNYDNLCERHADASLIVNTTPVGMYPACPQSPLSDEQLDCFTQLKAVIDIVYNPLHTGLVQAAEARSIPAETGLVMLVAQAHAASERFQDTTLDTALIEQIESNLLNRMTNIVLIGMPGIGKTGTGRRLAHLLGRPFVDMDDAITIEYGRSPSQIITEDGVEAFRALETKVTADYASRQGLIISCGGGVVTRAENYAPLHQNGIIIMLDRPIEQLTTTGRPLSQQLGVQKLAEERMPLYHAWADHILSCTGTPQGDAELLKDMLGL
ncbi:MAG: shikimate kinase [Atopobiaceae bacterium]|nr:shikimate kinase [Atopobiaceae bacterium]